MSKTKNPMAAQSFKAFRNEHKKKVWSNDISLEDLNEIIGHEEFGLRFAQFVIAPFEGEAPEPLIIRPEIHDRLLDFIVEHADPKSQAGIVGKIWKDIIDMGAPEGYVRPESASEFILRWNDDEGGWENFHSEIGLIFNKLVYAPLYSGESTFPIKPAKREQ